MLETNKLSGRTIMGKPWDSFDAYLFDIDGTLLHCSDAVHYFAFCDALQSVSGRPLTLDGVTAHGNTDVGILRDAFQVAGVPEVDWRPQLQELQSRMSRFVEAREKELCISVLPGVHEVLKHLQNKKITLGIATGNLTEIGRMKLRNAKLLDYFTIHGWSDAYEYRVDVLRGAVNQIRQALPPGVSICFVGDTPADIIAAKENSLPVIAVATGIYSEEQLTGQAPDLCLQSFEHLFLASEHYC